ncbi:MAG: hypothetical protein BWY99_02380 [Synergistetes bacterium ADurb.BinA166]|nr:MAG: hypothetical protein BWY99_02380 [Synergistetes bacterium ADurb.BinA166]
MLKPAGGVMDVSAHVTSTETALLRIWTAVGGEAICWRSTSETTVTVAVLTGLTLPDRSMARSRMTLTPLSRTRPSGKLAGFGTENVGAVRPTMDGSDVKPPPFTSIWTSTVLESTDPVRKSPNRLVVMTRLVVVPDPSK